MSGEEGFVLRTKPEEAVDFVERWIYTPALRELVEADGGVWPTGSLAEVVAELEEFSKVWDFRGGKSRLIFKEGDESRTDERAQRVYCAARSLGLLDPMPPSIAQPDYVLILGGLATGVEPRVRYAAQLVHSGTVRTACVAALGSFRQLHDRERPVAQTYAPMAEYEIDLLAAMVASSFETDGDWRWSGAGDPAIDPSRAERQGRRVGSPNLLVFAAQSSDPDARPANTADTYRQLAADEQLRTGQTAVIVTSSIYVPFQHMDALRTLGLGHDVTVETIGVPSTTASPSHPPSGYLQEIRSAVRSALELLGSAR